MSASDFSDRNQEALEQLRWAVEAAAPDTFVLVFAECDSLAVREQLVGAFKAESPLAVQELTLPGSVRLPFRYIQAELDGARPEVLFVYGLEQVAEQEAVLKALNHSRELFRDECRFPIVFWITSELQGLLGRVAKDWDSWGDTVAFQAATLEARREQLVQASDRLFALGLARGALPQRAAIAVGLKLTAAANQALDGLALLPAAQQAWAARSQLLSEFWESACVDLDSLRPSLEPTRDRRARVAASNRHRPTHGPRRNLPA